MESPLGENLSLALGTSELSLLELTSAYGTLANQGRWLHPTAVRYVLDAQGKLLEENVPEPKQVLTPELAFVATQMLKGTIERGTGVAAKARAWLQKLADERTLAGPVKAGAEFWDTVHAWYLQGFVQEGEEP